MKKVLFLVMILAFITTASFAAVQTGEMAPDFSLKDSTGQTQSLSDHKGKYVVLEWYNHECPFVKKHYNSGNMQSLQAKWTQKDVIWLSIISSAPGKQGHCTSDEAQEVKEVSESHPTAILLDESGDVGHLYDAKTTPHMYVINPEGKLIYQGAIDSVASADPADIEKAINYVDDALALAMAGKEVAQAMTSSYGCSVKY